MRPSTNEWRRFFSTSGGARQALACTMTIVKRFGVEWAKPSTSTITVEPARVTSGRSDGKAPRSVRKLSDARLQVKDKYEDRLVPGSPPPVGLKPRNILTQILVPGVSYYKPLPERLRPQYESVYVGKVIEFVLGGETYRQKWTLDEYRRWMSKQNDVPVCVLVKSPSKQRDCYYWWYRDNFYSTTHHPNEDVDLDEIRVQIDRRERKMERAGLSGGNTEGGRAPIPDDVRIFVWRRDEGRCVRCGSNADLEFDHIIPVVMGGSNTARNLQLLCEACNRSKGGHLV